MTDEDEEILNLIIKAYAEGDRAYKTKEELIEVILIKQTEAI